MPDNTKRDLVLTLDIGSSSLRTNLFSITGERLASAEAQSPYPVTTTIDGGVEIDPGELFDVVCAAIDRTLSLAGDSVNHIRGVGFCSLVSNVLGVDEQHEPTTPVYTWADTRSAGAAEQILALVDPHEVLERTGCPVHSSYLPARLLWLKSTLPERFEQTACWVSLGDWIYRKLFGRSVQSLSVASWGGLLNRHTLTCDEPLLDLLGIGTSNLPTLGDASLGGSGLLRPYAERWPALRDVPWFPCIGDGAAGNLGSGCYSERSVAIQVGTSAAVRALIPGPVPSIPEGLWCYRLDAETSLLGGALSEGGNWFGWLRDSLGIMLTPDLEQDAEALEPDAHGLTILPHIAGERSPGWNGSARGAITGLSLATNKAHIVRGVQEAVAMRLGLVFERLEGALPGVDKIVASGGALLTSTGWLRIVADVIGRPITASMEEEASSKGAAMMAFRSLGL
ncbi:MAG TPA: gluconokinase, partial [Chloroflexia bacterium]|nr:gluconokinase [Chloroflexia bacterium]